MNLPFFHRDRSEIAALRDRLIMAETSVVFLSDVLAAHARRRREPRKDKAAIIRAKAAMTARLRRETYFASMPEKQLPKTGEGRA